MISGDDKALTFYWSDIPVYSISQTEYLTITPIVLNRCYSLCEETHRYDEDQTCVFLVYKYSTKTCMFYDYYDVSTDFVAGTDFFISMWYYSSMY